MWKRGLTSTCEAGKLMLIWFSLCLFQSPGTSGLNRHVRQTQDNGAMLHRLSNLETLFIEERFKTTSLQNDLSEIKSRLDGLSSNLAAQRPIYDDEFVKSYVAEIITNILESIQTGLVSEKQQRLQLEDMAIDMKDTLEQKTNLFENRIDALERTYSIIQTMDQTRQTTRPTRPFVRQTRQTTRPTKPFVRQTRQTIRPTRPTTRPTSIQFSYNDDNSATSPRPGIVGGVKFSGRALNHNDSRIFKDCRHVVERGYRKQGVYRIHLTQDNPVLIRCHYEYMVVQTRRGNYNDLFIKSWDEYKHGFGDLDHSFWIGNQILWQAINSSSHNATIKIRLSHSARPSSSQDIQLYNTQLTNETDGYQLHYSHYKLTGYDDTGFLFDDQIPGNGYTFMTRDRHSRGGNCPDVNVGWWYQEWLGCRATRQPNNPNSRFIRLYDSQNKHHYGYLSYGKPGTNISSIIEYNKIWLDYYNRN